MWRGMGGKHGILKMRQFLKGQWEMNRGVKREMVVKREMERKMHSRAIKENYACRRKHLGFFSLGTDCYYN